MDDRKLEILLAAVQTGSFSRAAEKCSCTQSAVTQTMNHLEDELGCRLLERTHSGVRLTRAGEELLPYIVRAREALSELSRQAGILARGRTRPVRIAAFPSIAKTWLPGVLSEYQALHPETSFEILIGINRAKEWLLHDEADILLGDEARCEAFRWHPLMEDEYFAVVPRKWRDRFGPFVTGDEVVKHAMITGTLNALNVRFGDLAEQHIRIESDDDGAIINMVGQEIGISILPELSLLDLPEDVSLIPFRPRTLRRLGVALNNSPNETVQEFVRYLFGQKETLQKKYGSA